MTSCLAFLEWVTREQRFFGLEWSWLTLLGLTGNIAFSMRFILQWVASERQKRSVLPVSFWYWSIAGSAILCSYFILRRDPVGVLAYLPNSVIYFRNLHLIRKRQPGAETSGPQAGPAEPTDGSLK
jgi:lipid-A-disaccharide synthase-like uncharacterized protein